MLVTLLGIVTEVKPEQPKKALLPMLFTLLGIVTEVKALQNQKASSPMLVTLLGIVTEVKPEQEEKALPPMPVTLYAAPSCSTDSGITTLPEYSPLLFAITVACFALATRS